MLSAVGEARIVVLNSGPNGLGKDQPKIEDKVRFCEPHRDLFICGQDRRPTAH